MGYFAILELFAYFAVLSGILGSFGGVLGVLVGADPRVRPHTPSCPIIPICFRKNPFPISGRAMHAPTTVKERLVGNLMGGHMGPPAGQEHNI